MLKPTLSHVAGIVSNRGELLRVVVTENKDSFKYHCSEGERAVVTDLLVIEPVAWHLIPSMIARVRDFVHRKHNQL